MVALVRLLQPLGGLAPLAPSLWSANTVPGAPGPLAPGESLFKCPACGATPLRREADALVCPSDGLRWPIRDGIYDFKDTTTI
jgi:hypothetical protein